MSAETEKLRVSLQRGSSRRSSVVIKTKTNNLDEVLQEIGECSHYQIRRHVMFFLLSIPFACQSLFMVFAGQTPDICVETSMTECRKIDSTQTKLVCPFPKNYRFIQSTMFSVIAELVCDDYYLEQIANSVFFIGGFFGTIIVGWIAQRFGRKSVMFCCLAIVSMTATFSAFADSYWFLILARFLTGFFMSGVAVSLYCIASEITGATYRFQSDILIWNYFSVGLMVLALKAYLLQNWRNLQLVTTLPYLSVFVFFRIFPESLRWLWSTGQYTRANKTISKIATENHRSAALTAFPDVLSIETDDSDISCVMLFRSKKLVTYFCVMAYCSLVSGLIYYGLFLVSDYLTGNLYIDFVLMAAVEIPANFAAIFCTKRLGRKKTVIISFLITCALCGSLHAIVKQKSQDLMHASLCVGLLCKFFLTLAVLSCMLWTDELHHLAGRYQNITIVNSLRSLGGAVAPWLITFLSYKRSSIALAVMCGLSGLAGVLCILLPETKKDNSDITEDSECDDYTGLNGTIDQNLNKTKISNVSKTSSEMRTTEINFDYTCLSQVDRETNI